MDLTRALRGPFSFLGGHGWVVTQPSGGGYLGGYLSQVRETIVVTW